MHAEIVVVLTSLVSSALCVIGGKLLNSSLFGNRVTQSSFQMVYFVIVQVSFLFSLLFSSALSSYGID